MAETDHLHSGALLRLYVRSGQARNSKSTETLYYHKSGVDTLICTGVDGKVPHADVRSCTGAPYRQVNVGWHVDNRYPEAVLSQLNIDVAIRAVHVYFCSPCWQTVPVLEPTGLASTSGPGLRVQDPQRESLPTTVFADLCSCHCAQQFHAEAVFMMFIRFICSTPSSLPPKNEWFSVTFLTVKNRVAGYAALSSRDWGPKCTALIWQAVGTAALSYAVAWSAVGTDALRFKISPDQVDAFFYRCYDFLAWLCKEPGGFKVHPEWASALAQLVRLVMTVESKLALVAAANLHTFMKCIRWTACIGGCQMALCLVADALFALSLPIILVHKMSTVLQCWQVAAVTLTWDMVRNRVNARTQLRSIFRAFSRALRQPRGQRQSCSKSPTSCHSPSSSVEYRTFLDIAEEPDKDVMIEQMLVGMLFLAPLAATLPTTWLLHCVIASIHAFVATLRLCAYAPVCILDSGLAYRLMCWAGQTFMGGAALGAAPDITFLGTNKLSIAPGTPDSGPSDSEFDHAHVVTEQCSHTATSTSNLCRTPHAPDSPWQGAPKPKLHDYTCPVSYYQADAGYVSLIDALRPSLVHMQRHTYFMTSWYSFLPLHQNVT